MWETTSLKLPEVIVDLKMQPAVKRVDGLWNESLCFTLWLWLWLESKLEREVRALAQPVAGQREDGLQQHQMRLKVRSDGVLRHTVQPKSRTEKKTLTLRPFTVMRTELARRLWLALTCWCGLWWGHTPPDCCWAWRNTWLCSCVWTGCCSQRRTPAGGAQPQCSPFCRPEMKHRKHFPTEAMSHVQSL